MFVLFFAFTVAQIAATIQWQSQNGSTYTPLQLLNHNYGTESIVFTWNGTNDVYLVTADQYLTCNTTGATLLVSSLEEMSFVLTHSAGKHLVSHLVCVGLWWSSSRNILFR
jgi:hypothetical protein